MKKLSTWLIIIGIILIAVPFIGKALITAKQKAMYDEYQKQMELYYNDDNNINTEEGLNDNELETSDNKNNSDEGNTPNNNSNTNSTNNNAEKSKKNTPKLNVLGKISIPSIKIDMLFLTGTSDLELIYGAGHMTDTAFPGETGNCCIAAHRGFSFGTYFYRLDELKSGDIITIEYLKKEYKYKVYDSFIISPEDVDILKQPKDKKDLTLITCDPPITGTHRLVVKASLIE